MAVTSLTNHQAPLFGGPTVKQADLPQEIQEILRKRLPSEAIGKHPRIQGLSSIKAAFVIERLNEAFGVGGWDDTVKVIDRSTREEMWGAGTAKEKQITLHVATVHLTFFVEKYAIHKENFGGCDNVDLGDALKGTRTDALTKIASELGVGLDVYKGGHEQTGARAQISKGQAVPKSQPLANRPRVTTVLRPKDVNGSGFARQFTLACKKAGKTESETANYLRSLGFQDPTGIPPARYNEFMAWAQRSSPMTYATACTL